MNYQEAIAWVEQNYPEYSQAAKYDIARYVIQRSAAQREQQMSMPEEGGSGAGGIAAGIGVPVAGKLALDYLLPGEAAAETVKAVAPHLVDPTTVSTTVPWDQMGASAASNLTPNAAASIASGQPSTFLAGNVGPIADGGQYAADVAAGQGGMYGLSPMATGGLGAAGLVLGSKGVYDAYKAGNPLGGAISGAGAGMGGLALASSLGLIGATGGLALPVALAGAFLGGGAGLAGGHKSTEQAHEDRWNYLKSKGVNVDGAYKPHTGTGTWDTGKYAGQQWTFEKAKDLAMEDPTHFQHKWGNYDAMGNQWKQLSDQQQKSIVSEWLKNDLYESRKGGVQLKDKDRAKQIADNIISGGQQPTPQNVSQGAQNMYTPQQKPNPTWIANQLAPQPQQPNLTPAQRAVLPSDPVFYNEQGQFVPWSQQATKHATQIMGRAGQAGQNWNQMQPQSQWYNPWANKAQPQPQPQQPQQSFLAGQIPMPQPDSQGRIPRWAQNLQK